MAEIWLIFFLHLLYCSFGMKIFSDDLPNVVVSHLNKYGTNVVKMKKIHKTWNVEKYRNEETNDRVEIDFSKKLELPNQPSFTCCICYESRFLSYQPPCGHKLCIFCLRKIITTRGLNNKCALCRKNFPKSPCKRICIVNHHKISDLKPEEYNYAARFESIKILINGILRNV
jgi:hypothetical protein